MGHKMCSYLKRLGNVVSSASKSLRLKCSYNSLTFFSILTEFDYTFSTPSLHLYPWLPLSAPVSSTAPSGLCVLDSPSLHLCFWRPPQCSSQCLSSSLPIIIHLEHIYILLLHFSNMPKTQRHRAGWPGRWMVMFMPCRHGILYTLPMLYVQLPVLDLNTVKALRNRNKCIVYCIKCGGLMGPLCV